MRFTFLLPYLFAAYAVLLSTTEVTASEAATSADSAVAVFRAGIESHPDQLVPLFQDSLQTNPDHCREVLQVALALPNLDSNSLVAILSMVRLEFPDRDSEFAELALSVIPDRAVEIRAAFLASDDEMSSHIASLVHLDESNASKAVDHQNDSLGQDQRMDREIQEAIDRVEAKIRGRLQSDPHVQTPIISTHKSDEVRIPRQSWNADESTLTNHLPLDRTDEREMAAGDARIDDNRKVQDAIRLDESKFGSESGTASANSPAVKARSIAPAGSVGLPLRPKLARSSVYRIPPSAETFDSTIDQTTGEAPQPTLIIRPQAMKSSNPRMEMSRP